MRVATGKIVDATIIAATIIAAPSSTKNATETRDAEMWQTKRGKQWYFEMKFHSGTDLNGLVHHAIAIDAATADIFSVARY